MQERRPDVVILGASNVSFSFPTVVRSVQATFAGNVRLWAVHGLGRSYGKRSQAVMRELDGILESSFWAAFAGRPQPGPVFALLTDLGNDLIYEVEPKQIGHWVTDAMQRLQADVDERGDAAEFTLTRLPAAKLLSLGAKRYYTSQKLLYPHRKSDQQAMNASIQQLDAHIPAIAEPFGATVVGTERYWYGIDPIHLRERYRRQAWSRYLGGWPSAPPVQTPLVWPVDRARLHRLPRAIKWTGDRVVTAEQPCLVDGRFEIHQW